MKMTWKYYLVSSIWGLTFLGFIIFIWSRDRENSILQWILIAGFFSCFLYPFAKNAIENFALRFTTREFWNAGILADGVGKNSLLLFYYALCFALAIPLGLPRFIYLGFKRKAM